MYIVQARTRPSTLYIVNIYRIVDRVQCMQWNYITLVSREYWRCRALPLRTNLFTATVGHPLSRNPVRHSYVLAKLWPITGYLLKESGGLFLDHISLLNVLNKWSIKHNVNERFLITIKYK